MKIKLPYSLFQRKDHFTSYLNNVFRCLLIVLLFFCLILNNFSSVIAQVRIKEKIELKASNAQNQRVKNLLPSASSIYFPCGPFITSTDASNPWQVVWIGSSYPLDVAQQAFNYQSNSSSYMVNGNYTVEVIEGAENCSLVEVFRCDSITGECPDPISVNLGTRIENISHLDMEGEGDFMIWQGVPSRIPAGYVRYKVRFINPGNVTIRYSSSSGTITDFHTLVVQPDYYLEYNGTGDLPHGEEDEIDLRENIVQCQNEWSFWNGGGIPDNIKFNVSIAEGENYGKLILKSFDEDLFLQIRDTANSFSGLDDTHDLLYASLGDMPNDSAKVKIIYSTTDENIQPIDQELMIIPNENYPIRVTMFPDELMPGDTSFITLEKRIDIYPFDDPFSIEYEDFESDQLFDIKIEKGNEFGTIYSIVAEDTSDAFSQVEDGFFFIAKDTISVSSADVSIRAKAIIYDFAEPLAAEASNNVYNIKDKAKNKNSIAIIGVPTDIEEIFGIGGVKVEKDYIEIMLGESKYFQARYPDPTSHELVIEEVEVDENGIPHLNGGLADNNIWGENPITIVNDLDLSGQRKGLYWETQKPVFDGLTNRGNLTEGLIRVIGRYWHPDSSYIVKLKARRNVDSAAVNIKVVRPLRLVSEDQANSYSLTRDVNNNIINIDSLCIHYGGLNGIPPQFIKGQIFQESAKTDFGGEVGWGFAPSYLYEPYTVQTWRGILDNMSNNPFYITSTTNVNPPNHQHVRVLPYFSGDSITVWEIVRDHSQLVEDGSTPETRLYGVRTSADTMNYNAYPTIRNRYRLYFDETDSLMVSDVNGVERLMTLSERADSTNKRMIRYLRDEFTDNVGTVGMKNMIAQTRIASSYGYLQVLYSTAISRNQNWNYPEDSNHPPEVINEFDVIFPMATRMHNDYLIDNINANNELKNNWVMGFEASLEEYILEEWNTHRDYPSSVMNHTNKFLPQN